jgi:transcriptional regulator with XRE-family HTH domain
MPNDTIELDPEDVRVGATIKALRGAYGLTAAELGRLVGKSEALITAIERGERHATPAVCRSVADGLGVPLAAITVKGYAQAVRAAS